MMKDFMELQQDKSLGFIISSTALKIRTETSRRLKPFGLSPEQGFILSRLGEFDGITQKELADRTRPPDSLLILSNINRK